MQLEKKRNLEEPSFVNEHCRFQVGRKGGYDQAHQYEKLELVVGGVNSQRSESHAVAVW